ncbi:SusC/RagA family TonB-linked outer membrane protein [Flavitalea sp.]|nr:TonB-dependent receptor [Flavitalea sp.]
MLQLFITLISRSQAVVSFSWRRILLLTTLAIQLIFSGHAFGQSPYVVSGTVSSTQGDTLSSITVNVKNSGSSVITDEKGAYTIRISEKNSTLVFSGVGYENQEYNVNGPSTVNVSLAPSVNNLNSVVVVGYGTQKKGNITGSVATISSKDLTTVPTANVTSMLAGKLPGLVAVQRGGQPGNDDAALLVRGFSNPFIVVDGVPGREFTRLDPNEIETITILKDAASAAVYGVTGGNGVILVTTKKGKIGKPEFNYSANYGVQHVTKYPRMVNSAEFAELKNESSVNLGGSPIYKPEEIEKYRLGTDPDYPNFDYYHYFVRDYTPQFQQNITVRGGSDRIKYFFLLGSIKQESMWRGGGQDYGKYNFRSNVEAKITDGLDISVEFGARNEDRNNLVQDDFLMASWLQYTWPIRAPLTPDGKVTSTGGRHTAYLNKDLSGYIADDRNNFQGNLTINYKIPFVPGLSAKVLASRDLSYRDEKQWRKQYGLFNWDPVTQVSTQVATRESNTINLLNEKTVASRIQASLNYTRKFFDKHNIGALLLYEEAENTFNSFAASRINYVVPIDQIFAGPDLNKSNTGSAFDNGRKGLIGRVNYDFSGKYLFEYSFRYDGSPKFPEEKRWGFFSGISAGWRVSEESFIKDNFPAIDNLKLRGSWGQSGNDPTGNSYYFLTGYTYPSRSYVFGSNVVTAGLVDAGTPNPNITWEQIRQVDLGIDLSLWNGLLQVEANVFHRKREGLLATRAEILPSTFGAGFPLENLNSDDFKGFELVLGHANQVGAFRYNISGNVSFYKSRWDHVELRAFNSQVDNWQNNTNDRYKNRFFELKALGQFQSQQEINSSPVQDALANSTLRPGDIKYDDFNKDGVIDAMDKQPIGRGETPEINFGMGMDLRWKNFGINMNWQGAANFNVRLSENLIRPFNNDMGSYAYFMDRWHRADIKDPNSEWIPGKYPSTVNNGTPNNSMVSSFWIKDATYLRLKTLNISYNLESRFLRKYGVKNLMISISGQNLLTFSGLNSIGLDPEIPSGRGSYYPQQKTYNAGINITF